MASTNATETAATVKAAALTTAVTAVGSQPVTFSGLAASTTYYAHYVHRDAAGNDSTRVSSAAFATGAAGDTTPPTLTSPTATATGSSTATGSVTTNEANGALYRLASTNATETVATVKAAALFQAVTATGAQAVAFTGLAASTAYYAHYVHTDAAGNDSARVTSAQVTTSAASTATFTSEILRDEFGLILASQAMTYYRLYNPATGALVVSKSGLSTDTLGKISFTDAALSAATQYKSDWLSAAGHYRMPAKAAV